MVSMDLANYKSLYVRNSKIRDLLVRNFNGEAKKIRISGDAKTSVYAYLDMCVSRGVQELIDALPKKVRGENSGELKRITITPEDVGPLLEAIEAQVEAMSNVKLGGA